MNVFCKAGLGPIQIGNEELLTNTFEENSLTELTLGRFDFVNPYHAISILSKWKSWLVPGGKLCLSVPNLEKLCVDFGSSNEHQRQEILSKMYGIGEAHTPLFGWWPQSLLDHLMNSGYTNITFMDEKIPHPESNLRVECYKPTMPVDRDSLKNQEPGTYKEIFEQNGYEVQPAEIQGKTVIDVGANIGMFSLRCIELGASRIISVEAQPVIYNLGLLTNTKQYPLIEPLNFAVTDHDGDTVHIENAHVGSKVGGSIGETVETISLQSLLDLKNILGNDLVLKMDCEGSEFDILMPAPVELLRRFSTIYLEIHSKTHSNPDYQDGTLIEDKLKSCGFNEIKTGFIWMSPFENKPVALNVFVTKWVRQ